MQPENPLTTLQDEHLIGVYLNLRKRRDEAKKGFVDSQRKTLSLMGQIEAEMLRRLNERGTDSVANKQVGTAFKKETTSVTVKDWPAFFDWVMQEEAYDMLEHRAAKDAVVEFKNKHEQLPPGLSLTTEIEIQFRSPRGG